MFADDEDAVDGQLITAQTQGLGDALKNGNLVFLRDLQADIIGGDLLQLLRHNIHLRRHQPVVGGKAFDELADNHIGMGRNPVFSNDRRNFFAFPHIAPSLSITIRIKSLFELRVKLE